MKKSLIALAVLAASGAAMAQSSVTIYGIADAYVGVDTTKKTSAANGETKINQGVVNGSGLSSSRWGLKGSEDLGGGLSAVFTLESGFDISTGTLANTTGQKDAAASGSTLFGRTASVGLKGNFGEARLGRQYTAYDDIRSAFNNVYDSNTFATTSAVWASPSIAGYSNRVNNAVSYRSPEFSGFSGAVVYGFGEDKTTAHSAANSVSLNVKYANGPLAVAYAYQREKEEVGSTLFSATSAAPATIANSRKYNLFAASYDFGVAKLTGAYNQAKDDQTKDKQYQIGVSVPFGAAALAAGYAHSKSEGLAAVQGNKSTGFSLLGTYGLSKRTTLYAGYINTKVETPNVAATVTNESKRDLFAAGLRHTF